jgi:LIM homeobox protein 2/9
MTICPLSFSDLNADYLDVPFGRSGPGTPGLPGSNGQQRTKRMRTSFKHHQLRTMKSYFAINHNPDAKDLKQLSQKTGLPKRVLQVRDAVILGPQHCCFAVSMHM